MSQLIDTSHSISENTDGLIIETVQHIPDSFLQGLQNKRFESTNVREGEMMHVASLPVCLVEKWMKEGFDITNEPFRRIVARLKHEGLDYFLATSKQV